MEEEGGWIGAKDSELDSVYEVKGETEADYD